jgi:beta-galactosidase/beta-glucuronidase
LTVDDLRFIVVFILMILSGSFVNGQDIPRPEYPRPQMERTEWLNLNGPWTCVFDNEKSGLEKDYKNSKGFGTTINVPFCPESKLSGLSHTDFITQMWYHRTILIPASWIGNNVILHFGAVDFECEVFIDGQPAGRHWGGTSSFAFDITKYVKPGTAQNLVLLVRDDTRSGVQPGGKQSDQYASYGCMYTRTTGIWQTVWMEPVAPQGIDRIHIVPDIDNNKLFLTLSFYHADPGTSVKMTLLENGKAVATQTVKACEELTLTANISKPHLWSPEDPFLYDLKFEVSDQSGKVVDVVKSYAGLRKISITGNKLYLNNKPVFLRFVLDQGFYPDGIWTAPSDASLKNDIQLAMQAGFNGARLHQKVFEERFHYWADRLGYLTSAECSSWGADANNLTSARNLIPEWEEIVVRDRNHPSVIMWTPFNETWERGEEGRQHDRLLSDIYVATKRLDATRPVHDVSGGYHQRNTDIWSWHNYEQDPEKFRKQLAPDTTGGNFFPPTLKKQWEAPYAGQPYFLDEYGGIKWIPGAAFSDKSWGYGNAPKTLEEYYTRLEALTDIILSYKYIIGYCYTQLTDIEQEQNGIYNYDRTPKFDMGRIHAVFSKTKGN